MVFVVSVTLICESAKKEHLGHVPLNLLLQVISQIYLEIGPRREHQD